MLFTFDDCLADAANALAISSEVAHLSHSAKLLQWMHRKPRLPKGRGRCCGKAGTREPGRANGCRLAYGAAGGLTLIGCLGINAAPQGAQLPRRCSHCGRICLVV